MKQIKKIVSLLITLVMTLSMTSTVFATAPTQNANPSENTPKGTGNFTITINAPEDGKAENYSYKAYQIFKGDLAGSGDQNNENLTLSNIEWGDGVDAAKVATAFPKQSAAQVAETLNNTGFDSPAAKEFAAKIAKCLSSTSVLSAIKEDKSGYTISGLNAGYYLVMSENAPAEDGALTRYMMEVVGNVTATPKSDVPTTDKKIIEGNDKVSTNEASIGDEVNYEITGTMPSNIADYKTYYYMFTDTLSKGLTYKENSIKVTVNGVDVTKYFYKGVGTYNETTGTTIEVGILDLKALSLLTNPTVGEITKDTKVVLTYTATLNENAVIAGDGNPNDVKLSYSNDPNNSGDGSTTPPENPEKPVPEHPKGETPKVEVVTYTTELTILKTDEDNKFLPGVEFTLTGNGVNVVLVTEEIFTEAADGEYWKLKDGTYTTTAPTVADDETDNTADYDDISKKYNKTIGVVAKGNGKTETEVVGTVLDDGTVTFKGLGAGEYTITETKTLPGYNTIEPIKFTLTFNAETKTFVSDNENVTVGEDNMLDTSIVNQKGSLLPSTGGIGTTIFYIIGGILVVGAAILLITKKRMSSEA